MYGFLALAWVIKTELKFSNIKSLQDPHVLPEKALISHSARCLNIVFTCEEKG